VILWWPLLGHLLWWALLGHLLWWALLLLLLLLLLWLLWLLLGVRVWVWVRLLLLLLVLGCHHSLLLGMHGHLRMVTLLWEIREIVWDVIVLLLDTLLDQSCRSLLRQICVLIIPARVAWGLRVVGHSLIAAF
jgi:hypothetical protein